MKYILLFSTILMFLWSCSDHQCTHNEKGAENIALIEKYIDAVEQGDYETIAAMTADNYVGHGPAVTDTINKEEGLASWKSNLKNLYESIEYSRSRNIAVTLAEGAYPGDWVSNWGLVTIKYKDGRGSVKVLANTLYKIEEGKIARSFTIYNEHDVLEQLGIAGN